MLAANRGLPVIAAIATVIVTVVITLFPSSVLRGSRPTTEPAVDTVQETGTPLGGLDLNGYCRTKQAGVVVLIEDRWTCQQGTELATIDLNDACRLQHNFPDAVARKRDPSSNYSWACFR